MRCGDCRCDKETRTLTLTLAQTLTLTPILNPYPALSPTPTNPTPVCSKTLGGDAGVQPGYNIPLKAVDDLAARGLQVRALAMSSLGMFGGALARRSWSGNGLCVWIRISEYLVPMAMCKSELRHHPQVHCAWLHCNAQAHSNPSAEGLRSTSTHRSDIATLPHASRPRGNDLLVNSCNLSMPARPEALKVVKWISIRLHRAIIGGVPGVHVAPGGSVAMLGLICVVLRRRR